jgi:hypothetical protein
VVRGCLALTRLCSCGCVSKRDAPELSADNRLNLHFADDSHLEHDFQSPDHLLLHPPCQGEQRPDALLNTRMLISAALSSFYTYSRSLCGYHGQGLHHAEVPLLPATPAAGGGCLRLLLHPRHRWYVSESPTAHQRQVGPNRPLRGRRRETKQVRDHHDLGRRIWGGTDDLRSSSHNGPRHVPHHDLHILVLSQASGGDGGSGVPDPAPTGYLAQWPKPQGRQGGQAGTETTPSSLRATLPRQSSPRLWNVPPSRLDQSPAPMVSGRRSSPINSASCTSFGAAALAAMAASN